IDGPEWVISPVVTGAGTLYPNSVVRMYNDVYFWGPCGPARLRYGSSEIENLAVGKCQRAVTEFQNSAFLDYCFEIDDFTYPITGDELFGNTWGTDISAAADYRANLVAFFHGEVVTTGPLDPDLARRSGCLVYDISTNRFSFFSVPSKVKYAKSVPRYGRNPLSPSAGNFSQHSVLDGVFCALNNDTMLVTTSIELANSIG